MSKTQVASLLFVLVSAWVTGSAARAQTLFEKVLQHGAFVESMTQETIASRCKAYLSLKNIPRLKARANQEECVKVSAELYQALDLEIVDIEGGGRLPVIFRQDLLRLSADERFRSFLEELLLLSGMVAQGRLSLNTWQVATDTWPESADAITAVAAFFQHVKSDAHLQWLARQNLGPYQQETLGLMQKLYEKLRALGESKYRAQLTTIPEGHGVAGSNRQYHFFVPAALALKMNLPAEPTCPRLMSVFLFNYIYEVADTTNPVARYFTEPGSIEGRGTVADIGLGLKGIFLASPNVIPPGFDTDAWLGTMREEPIQAVWDLARSCQASGR